MIGNLRILALIPARSGSKGLPGKNVRPLGGKPLLTWPITAARNSRYVDRVVVSTDSVEYARIAAEAGAEAPFIRPDHISNDAAPSIDFILHALDELERSGDGFDLLVLLEPTSPLTESSDVDSALETLAISLDVADSIVGVTPLVSSHPAFAVSICPSGLLRPFAGGHFAQLPRRQDTEQILALDGSLYISTISALRRERAFCHDRTLPKIMPRYKSFEVDDLLDFVCIEAIMHNRAALSASEQEPKTNVLT